MWLAKNGVVVVLCSPTDVLVCIYNKCVCVCFVCEFWLFYNTHTSYRQQILSFFNYYTLADISTLTNRTKRNLCDPTKNIYILD